MEEKPAPISAQLDDLTCELIGMCLDELASGTEVWPTLACGTSDGDATCCTFDGDTIESCLAEARDKVRTASDDIVVYALAYAGFVQLEELGTTDALLVEFGERGTRCAYSAYVPYRCGRNEEEFESGEPLAAGEEPLLFN